MDLRSIPVPQHEIGVMKTLIARRLVSYQPFIFADDLEVGEGWAFATGTSASWPPQKGVVHWPDCPQTIAPLAVPEDEVEAFRKANAALRNWYKDNVRLIAGLVGRPSRHDFLELGCHNGYVLHRLSEMGARRAIGVNVASPPLNAPRTMCSSRGGPGAGRSIYAPETSPRRLDPQLIEEGVQGQFNIIHFDGMYYALAQDEGEFSIEKVRLGAYRRCVVGASLAEIKQRAAADLG